MKVLIVEPGKYPREAEIENTTAARQAVVGGLFEIVNLWKEDGVLLACNESFLVEGLPLNRAVSNELVIGGTFFLCGDGYDHLTDLPADKMEKYRKMLERPQIFSQTPFGLCVMPCTPEQYARAMCPQKQKRDSPGNAHER